MYLKQLYQNLKTILTVGIVMIYYLVLSAGLRLTLLGKYIFFILLYIILTYKYIHNV